MWTPAVGRKGERNEEKAFYITNNFIDFIMLSSV